MYQRNGSGALMLAYVGAGRLLGYLEAHINAWDCLAGILLVEEAGGWTNDFLANDGFAAWQPHHRRGTGRRGRRARRRRL